MSKRHASSLALLCLLAGTPSAAAGTILFVSDTTTDTDIAAVLTADGHGVTTVLNDAAGGNMALKGDLSPYDAVYWSTSQVNHNDAPLIATLTAWVTAGGHLFVTGADGVIASYNPTADFRTMLGATDGCDCGYALTNVANIANSVTMGVVDIRGATVMAPGDSDSVCGPLAAGTTGLSSPTSYSMSACGGSGLIYGWTLRNLGSGEIAWVESGNFTSTMPPDEPDWTDTSPASWGAYNGAVRNFAFNASLPPVPALPGAWMLLAGLAVVAAGARARRRRTSDEA